MAKKRELLITDELNTYEQMVEESIAYVKSIKLSELEDRIEWKPTGKGGMMPMVIASKESQVKSYFDSMEKIPKLLNGLDELRNKYADVIKETRGDVSVPALFELDDE